MEYEVSRCPLGCDHDAEPLFEATDRLHGQPGRFGVVKCRGCDLIRTSPRVPEHAIGAYYPSEYGPHDAAAARSAIRRIRARAGRPGALARLRRALNPWPTLPVLPPGRALEFGCGSGVLLEALRAEGWSVQGIELSPDAVEVARSFGHDVFCGRVEDAPAPAQPYDLIVGLMVLEHLYDPVAALRVLAGWSGPSTRLVVSVPNAASLEFSLFRDAWFALQVPTHITHFTPATLRRVLAAGGWTLERVIHQPNLGNALMSAHYVARDHGAERLSRALEGATRSARAQRLLRPLSMGAATLGQTGRMTAWARRSAPGD